MKEAAIFLLLINISLRVCPEDVPEIRIQLGHSSFITSIAVSPDKVFALTGSEDNTMKLWSIPAGKEMRTFIGHDAAVTSVAFSPDGKYGISGSLDATVRLWDLSGGG